ncbi:nucleoside hydrolase [Corynebacterium hansenii]|uniref:Nucleoside hydrolase n=1 Tax=Corynebacterium hansenii TaxID=394964 RepID=A0ABV7ZPR5_9CORY|nr:nucleoside hydrolase [Corynebacterium hansenii]WJZ01142.1 Pyrimidine-specific ribonucleoside hydrolase RihA [Corynebacterium hansenii]
MRRLVADVDTGIDDMLALIYLAGLHRAGEIELAAVTATAGNTTVCQAARNSRWVLDLCGCPDVPVAAGFGAPLKVPLTTTPETHGEFGLGFARPPSVGACDASGAAPGLWKRVLDDGPADLLITGPLTTAARYPGLAAAFGRITVMGGAVDHPGNTTPTAEWNFWVDPDAVAAVFAEDSAPLVLCPLDVTETIIVRPEDVGRWAIPGELGDVVADALRFYFGFHRGQGIGYLAQVHDLFAAMVACGTVETVAKPMTLRAVAGDRGAVERGEGRAVDVVSHVEPSDVHAEFERVLALNPGYLRE